MKRHVLSALIVTTVLAATGCTEDPVAALRSGPKRLLLSASTLTVNVDDSVAVTATVVDDQGNPLPDGATATSSAPTVVSVINSSGAPLPVSKFFVKGLLFGSAFVKASAGGVSDSMAVIAYPARVSITTNPTPFDSLGSGTTVSFTANPLSATNQAVAGITSYTWTTTAAAIAAISGSGQTVTVSGATPGVANISIAIPGGVTTTKPVRVYPGPFNGTFSASADPGEVATATRAVGGPPFDGDTQVLIGTLALFIHGTPTADAIQFAVPTVSAAGPATVSFNNVGPGQLALKGTLNIESNTVADTYEPANDTPGTAPDVGNGSYYFILHGDCADPGSFYGEPVNVGDECDDYFTVTNSAVTDKTVTFRVQWQSGADLDIYLLDAGGSELVGVFTVANPEVLTATIPAGVTRRFRINNYDNHGAARTLARMTVSGL